MHEIIAGVVFCDLVSFVFCGNYFLRFGGAYVWLVTQLLAHPTSVRIGMGSISVGISDVFFVLRSGIARSSTLPKLPRPLKTQSTWWSMRTLPFLHMRFQIALLSLSAYHAREIATIKLSSGCSYKMKSQDLAIGILACF